MQRVPLHLGATLDAENRKHQTALTVAAAASRVGAIQQLAEAGLCKSNPVDCRIGSARARFRPPNLSTLIS